MNNSFTPGLLDTNKLDVSTREDLHYIMEEHVAAFPATSGSVYDAYYVIIDSGASRSTTNSYEDVIPGSLKILSQPIDVGGI